MTTTIYLSFKSLKDKKSRHNIDLPMFLWKLIAAYISVPVSDLINQMILETNFPKIFKYADIIPIHKKGDKKLLNNYRSIATLHNLLKVFENIILNRILDFCHKFYLHSSFVSVKNTPQRTLF